ncbi:MAG: DUF1592 domain-containing protein [Myxococcota bacterium]
MRGGSRKLKYAPLLVSAIILGGCYGGRDGGGNDGDPPPRSPGADDAGDGGDGPAEQACDPDGPSPTDLKRLSALQYRNTLRDLFGTVPGLPEAIDGALLDLPLDEADDHSFSGMDLRLTQRHVTTYFSVADSVANAVLEDSSAMTTLSGDCAVAPQIDDACLEAFVRDFGLRVHRRPLDDEDVELYLGLVDPERTGPETYRDIVFAMLMSPAFHYHFETEGGGDEDVLALDGYEIANRLSYHLWQTMPDDELFAAAEDGSLQTEAGFEAAVERMVYGDGRERTAETIEGFYREWLDTEELGAFIDTPAFNAFAEGVPADDALVDAMQAEVDALAHHFTFDNDGQFTDLITSDLSFTQDPALAALYGVAPWDGSSAPPQFPAGERSGVLTRAAMLFSGDEKTNPIFRGIDVRERLLCLELALPDPSTLPDDAFDPPPIDPMQSTRQRYDAKTAAAECQACHTQINPLGYVQEAYDALGRYRTTERIFDDSGTLIGEQPIDTAVSITGLSDTTENFEGPVDLMEWLADDPRVHSCFAKHYFQFTFRRDPIPNDACVVENVATTLADDSILDALVEIAMQPEFRLRKVGS